MVVTEEIYGMLEAKFIEPTQSEWERPVMISPKAYGPYGFDIYYLHLNAVTLRDTYPLPCRDDCIDSFGDAKQFSLL